MIRLSLPLLLAPLLLLGAALAQTEGEASVTLSAAPAPELIEFATGPQQSREFTLPAASRLVLVLSPARDLDLALALPGGDVISAADVGGYAATFAQGTIPEGNEVLAAGETQFILLDDAPAGTYRLDVDASGAGAVLDNGAVILQLFPLGSAGGIRTGLGATGVTPTLEAGRDVALTALVFDADGAVAGATVTGRLYRSDGADLGALDFRDDGVAPDHLADDGLYTGSYAPSEAGTFVAVADIAASSGGLEHARREIAEFTVYPRTAHLSPLFEEEALDTDGDGYVDELRLRFGLDGAPDPGTYALHVFLDGDGGSVDARSANLDLAGGDEAAVTFPAADLRRLGDGPYRVRTAVFTYGRRLVDRLEDLGSTEGYPLGELERDDILVSPLTDDRAADDDGDGRYDRLDVRFSVDVLDGGSYGISANLQARDGSTIDVAGIPSTFLAAGEQEVALTFSGLRIGASGADGPFEVASVLVYRLGGSSGTAIVDSLGETGPYACRDFAGCSTDYDFDALLSAVDALDTHHGIRNSLHRKASNAKAAYDRGATHVALNLLHAMLNQVDAQRGEHLTEADAAHLTEIITSIRNSL